MCQYFENRSSEAAYSNVQIPELKSREFQTDRLATEKACRPHVLSRYRGITR